MKRIVLIPAFKPDKLMTELLVKLSENDFSVVVVNDGSGEEYEDMFHKAEQYAAVISHKENKGKGIALKTGLRYIDSHYESPYCVVTADADGQHRVEDIIRVADKTERNPDALTLGVRQIDRAHMPFKNRSGNIFTRSAVFCVTGKYISDSQTGLRGFSQKAIPLLTESAGVGYEYEMNALIRWLKYKKPVSEIPIETIYINNNASSHFRAFRDSIEIYKEICRFFSASLIKLAVTLLFFLAFALNTAIPKNILFYAVLNILSIALGAGAKLLCNKFIFKPKTPMTRSTVRSVLFCAFYCIISTALLALMIHGGTALVTAKLLTELGMFILSWIFLKEIL